MLVKSNVDLAHTAFHSDPLRDSPQLRRLIIWLLFKLMIQIQIEFKFMNFQKLSVTVSLSSLSTRLGPLGAIDIKVVWFFLCQNTFSIYSYQNVCGGNSI